MKNLQNSIYALTKHFPVLAPFFCCFYFSAVRTLQGHFILTFIFFFPFSVGEKKKEKKRSLNKKNIAKNEKKKKTSGINNLNFFFTDGMVNECKW